MAIINKDFRLKNGLIVEGSTATVNGYDILTKSTSDQNYIIGLIGGSATSAATPDTVVLRDENGSFSAVEITADLIGDVTGTVSSLSNHSTSDLSEGSNLYYTKSRVEADAGAFIANANKTNIAISYDALNGLVISAENGVADSTTDDLTEGQVNKYFTVARAQDALEGMYDPAGSALTAENNAKSYADGLAVNYDPAGAADSVQGNLETHASTTSTHGVTGDIVGTSDQQTLTNKTIADNLIISDGQTFAGTIGATQDGKLAINASQTLYLHSDNSDIELVSGQGYHVYINGTSAENEIATHGYVDNAVAGLNWKQAVNLLANTNVNITAQWPVAGIDGHPEPIDMLYRVLLTNQTDVSQNGIYTYDFNSVTWTRSTDADTYQELIGAAVYVMEGTQFGSTSWVQGNHYLTDFTTQTWTQFSGQGSVTAGNGIVVDGLEVSIDTAIVATQTDLADGLATKQDTLTAGDNIFIASNTISVTGLTTANVSEDQALGGLYFTDSRAVSAVTGLNNSDYYPLNEKDGKAGVYKPTVASTLGTESINGSGIKVSGTNNSALAIDRATVDTWYDASGTATTEISNALGVGGSISDAIATATPDSTDDLLEGINNLYYTDNRAKTATRNVLVNATKNNIQITEDLFGNLTITAENGVADSTTDDLDEGSTNLYFNNGRAIDAINGNLIQPEKIDIAMYRREEATQQYVANASTVNVHELTGMYESVKYLVRVVGWDGGVKHSQITEILMTVDGNNNIAITEYGNVHTSTNPLATFSAAMTGALPNFVPTLTATTAVNGCEIVAAATMLSWAD